MNQIVICALVLFITTVYGINGFHFVNINFDDKKSQDKEYTPLYGSSYQTPETLNTNFNRRQDTPSEISSKSSRNSGRYESTNDEYKPLYGSKFRTPGTVPVHYDKKENVGFQASHQSNNDDYKPVYGSKFRTAGTVPVNREHVGFAISDAAKAAGITEAHLQRKSGYSSEHNSEYKPTYGSRFKTPGTVPVNFENRENVGFAISDAAKAAGITESHLHRKSGNHFDNNNSEYVPLYGSKFRTPGTVDPDSVRYTGSLPISSGSPPYYSGVSSGFPDSSKVMSGGGLGASGSAYSIPTTYYDPLTGTFKKSYGRPPASSSSGFSVPTAYDNYSVRI